LKEEVIGMRIKVVVSIVAILLIALCGSASAEPGIMVEVAPSSQAANAGSTIDYTLKVTNLDTAYSKTIKSVSISVAQGWSYTLDPDIVGQTLPAGGSMETTVHIYVPSTASAGSYNNQATVEVEYEPIPGWSVTETGYSVFITQVKAAVPPWLVQFWKEIMNVSGSVSTGELDASWELVDYSDDEYGFINVSVSEDGKTVTITIENAYPGYEATINLNIVNTGSIVAKIGKIELNKDEALEITYPEVEGEIMDKGQKISVPVKVEVNDLAEENSSYSFSLTFEVRQFNK